jgi:hypothetical protein
MPASPDSTWSEIEYCGGSHWISRGEWAELALRIDLPESPAERI